MAEIKNWKYKIIESPTWISIIIGIILLLWQQITGELTYGVQLLFFIFFIVTTGIPHGAIDHLVEKETLKRENKIFGFNFFLLKYLLYILFYGLMWYFLPSMSLLFFLIISAEHFGETDIEKTPPILLWYLTRFSFGCFILLWLLLPHATEVTSVLARISQNNITVMFFWEETLKLYKPVIALSLTIFFSLFYFSQKKQATRFDKIHFFRLSCILVLSYFLPLLPAFALYFGGWHALNSFKNTSEYLLNDSSNSNRKPTRLSMMRLWKASLLFTALALLFLSFSIAYWYFYLQTFDPLPILFIFLSIITLPHLNVMHKLNKAKI